MPLTDTHPKYEQVVISSGGKSGRDMGAQGLTMQHHSTSIPLLTAEEITKLGRSNTLQSPFTKGNIGGFPQNPGAYHPARNTGYAV